jgi:hypothetical protein
MDYDDQDDQADARLDETPEDEAKRELFEAVERGDHSAIRALSNRTGVIVPFDDCDSAGRTALYLAAEDGNTECIWELLNAGANVNARSEGAAVSALNAALYLGQVDAALALLSRRADPRIRTEEGETALHNAVALGARVDDDDTRRKVLEIVQRCIIAGVPINQPDNDGKTPLIKAVHGSAPEAVVALLLAHGAQVSCADQHGNQAIHRRWAAANIPILHLLVAAGANVNARNFGGTSPMLYAGDLVGVDALLDLGADVNQVDYEGRNLLVHKAFNTVGGARADVLVHLIGRGLDIDTPGYDGETAWRRLEARVARDRSDTEAPALLAAMRSVKARAAIRSAVAEVTIRPAV